MMTDTNKRISIRVSEELFEELNDKRHATRVSFQSLGLALFRSWLERFPGVGFSAAVADAIRAQEPAARIPEEDPAAVAPASQEPDVSPEVKPLLPAFVEFWENPKNRAQQHLKDLLAETVFKEAIASSTRKTSGL